MEEAAPADVRLYFIDQNWIAKQSLAAVGLVNWLLA